jgi:hypothetical protein
MSKSTNVASGYFDLHTRGLGYVNRIRAVPVKNSDSYLACTIAALRGKTDEPEYTYFDCIVTGEEAIKVINRAKQAVIDKKKVLIGFSIGDTYPELFTYKQGDKKGQSGISLKSHLLKVLWVDVDGNRVYDAPATDNPNGETVVVKEKTTVAPEAPKPVCPAEEVKAVDPVEYEEATFA